MKISSSIILFLVKQSFEYFLQPIVTEPSNLSLAITDLSLKMFCNRFNTLRILSSVSKEMEERKDVLVTDIIEIHDSKIKIMFENVHFIGKTKSKRGSPIIIFVDSSLQSFQKINEKLSFDNLRFRKYYLLVLLQHNSTEIENILKSFWKFWIFNISIITENVNGNISLYTYFPFTNKKCSKSGVVKEINSFSSQWESEIFFPEKFKDLKKCPLKVGCLSYSSPSVFVKPGLDGQTIFDGFEVDLINEIAGNFNLTTKFGATDTVGTIFANGSTSGGVLPAVFNKKTDGAIGMLSLQFDRTAIFSETRSFLPAQTVLVIPRGAFISPYRKLLAPFNLLVWMLLMAIVLVGVIIIFMLKFHSKTAYEFVVGKGINYPFLNMLAAIFGISQWKLPRKNFARFLLLMFLMFCLIIRCLYQARLFIILQKELREKEVDTIDEAIDKGMVFFAYDSLMKRIKGQKIETR